MSAYLTKIFASTQEQAEADSFSQPEYYVHPTVSSVEESLNCISCARKAFFGLSGVVAGALGVLWLPFAIPAAGIGGLIGLAVGVNLKKFSGDKLRVDHRAARPVSHLIGGGLGAAFGGLGFFILALMAFAKTK